MEDVVWVARGLEAPVPKAATNFETNNTQKEEEKNWIIYRNV